MEKKIADRVLLAMVLGINIPAMLGQAATAAAKAGPTELRVDGLNAPVGIDDPSPRFSWQLHDPARAAAQTAYEVLVASSAASLAAGKADIWDSGRVVSDASLNVHYAGPAIEPSKRYFWRVEVWGAAGKSYGPSATSWWESGLVKEDGWRAVWIGFETPEEDAVRHAPSAWITSPHAKALAAEKKDQQRIAYRQVVTLAKPVKSATLYATGQDTVSAWVNGAQVLTANPFPPYKQMPWKKFVRADVTKNLAEGGNAIAIEALHYVANPNGMASDDPPPMIATLIVNYADGTTAAFASDTSWKASIHGVEGWQQKSFDDSGWEAAVVWSQAPGPMNAPLGHPWIPDSVKALRHDFEVESPVKSARIYATSLGTYELFLNGKRVGDDVMDPGWTDYREHVKYQTYDVTTQVKAGKNAIGALLAPGWYETPIEWFQQPNNYGDHATRIESPTAHRARRRQCRLGRRPIPVGRQASSTFCIPSSTTAKARTRGASSRAGIRRVSQERDGGQSSPSIPSRQKLRPRTSHPSAWSAP
jgi:alpha-L-rhamnosidase